MYISTTNKFGKTRSEQEVNLRKEGWGSTITDEQLDKAKFLEKKKLDYSKRNFLSPLELDKVK